MLLLAAVLALVGTNVLAAEVLLSENFDSIPDGQLPAGFTPLDGAWEVKGGKLVGHSPNTSTQTRIVFGDSSWTNYEISASVTYEWARNDARWTALMYRVQGLGGPPYYLFTVRRDASAPNGLEQAYRTPDAKWSVFLTQSWRSPVEIGMTIRLRAVIYETAVRYYINDELVMESNDLVVDPNGMVGLHVNGSTVAFDDLVVRKITAEDVPEMAAAVAALQK